MIDAYVHRIVPGKDGGPLMFLFHGTGGNENQFVKLGRELLPEARLVSPRGDVSERGAARFFRRTGEGVYDMTDLARATEKMTGFIDAHVAAAKPSRVLGLGYSNGANILASVLFARPDLFDDAVLMHPLIPWEPEPVAMKARVLITAGERDPICPPGMTRALGDWFAAQGARVETVWQPGGHEIDGAEIAAVTRFVSGGA